MMLGLTTCMSTPVASISLTRSGSSVIRLNNGSGTPPSTATPRAYCERSKVRFTTSGTRRWACTSMTIGLGARPLEAFAALRLALYDLERVRRRDGRAACLRRLIAVGIHVLQSTTARGHWQSSRQHRELWVGYFGGMMGTRRKDSLSPP